MCLYAKLQMAVVSSQNKMKNNEHLKIFEAQENHLLLSSKVSLGLVVESV